MSKILFIANQFPPIGGSGVQRSLKFVKYLSRLGNEVLVVSKDASKDLKDYSLLNDVPENVRVIRLKAHDINNSGLIKKVYAKFFALPDAEVFWYKFNKKEIEKIALEFNPDVIYTTSYPYSAHLFGLYLKEKFPKMKWIVDYRDEWTNNPFHLDSFSSRIKMKLSKKTELEINSKCDYFITNTRFMLDNFIADLPELKNKSTYIPNGYDEEDFLGIYPKEKSDKFTFIHTGALYGRRNLHEFLSALKELIDEGKIDKSDIRINIAGNVKDSQIEEYKKTYDLEKEINYLSYLAHEESIRKLLEADVLLLLIGKGKGSENFYTGKVFEYLRAYKNILAIVPKHGAAGELIEETKTGVVAEPGETREIKNAIMKLYENYNSENNYYGNKELIKKYSREAQAEELNNIINKILEE